MTPSEVVSKARDNCRPTHGTREIRPYEYWGRVEHVVDGDTVDFLISVGFEIEIRVRVRFLGVNTPEIHGVRRDSDEYKAGRVAADMVESILPVGRWVEVRVFGGPREKYGRWLGEVFVDGFSLNELLIERGYVQE